MVLTRIGTAAAVLLAFFLAACSSGPSGPRIDFTEQVVVAFGDSITEGYGDTNYPRGPSGYPYRLEILLSPNFPNTVVLNRGVGGERTLEGVRRLNSVLARDNPDYVLILEGVNNIRDGGTSWVGQIVTDLETMVRTVKASGATPLLASLLPTWGPRGFENATVQLVNPLIEDLAARENVAFIDLNAIFLEQDNYTSLYIDDGLHPNSAGYDLIAQSWYDELLARL